FLGARSIQRMSSLSPSEGSTASRIAIYRCVPAMVMAAPGGWEPGRAASAYENWFQDPGDTTTFKNLLSTHATWIVERGILFFVCYAVLWTLALWFCNPAALGVLVAWGTCCTFSHVGGAWWMWVVPGLAVFVSAWTKVATHRGNGRPARLGWRAMRRQRPLVSPIQNWGRHGGHPSSNNSAAHGRTFRQAHAPELVEGDAHAPCETAAIRHEPVSLGGRWNQWPSRSTSCVFAGALFTGLLLFFLTAAMGCLNSGVHYDGKIVRVGTGKPIICFLAPDFSVVGKTYGKSLRAMGSLAVAEHWEDVQTPSLLVLSGEPPNPVRFAENRGTGILPVLEKDRVGRMPPMQAGRGEPPALADIPACGALVWLNPPAKISPELKRLVENTPRKTIFWGALRSDSNPRELRAWFESLPGTRWFVVPGRGKFLGDGLGIVTKL
ncbi:MAG: hypothetical protein ACOYM3_33060, partial [Terrimicrobiaceae bacterium]